MAIVKCIRPYGTYAVGQEVEVPDGADYSPYFFAPYAAPVAEAPQTTPEGTAE